MKNYWLEKNNLGIKNICCSWHVWPIIDKFTVATTLGTFSFFVKDGMMGSLAVHTPPGPLESETYLIDMFQKEWKMAEREAKNFFYLTG